MLITPIQTRSLAPQGYLPAPGFAWTASLRRAWTAAIAGKPGSYGLEV
ncbi:hypothetical protein ACIPIN_02410 [Pseudomonas sp. NPDC087697]